MAWRLASSLEQLRRQINDAAPKRNKLSDGTIGNEEHSSRTSDHNPDSSGIVRAMDITHDPANGVDCGKITDALLASRDPRIKYIIYNRRIASQTLSPWKWRPYSGANPHTRHMHVSVVTDARGDSVQPWALPSMAPKPSVKPVPPMPILREGSRGDVVGMLQGLLNKLGAELRVDEIFGPRTENAVEDFQRAKGLVADGIVGPVTWDALT